MTEPYALYLHIPFCAARCPYCDFNTYAGLERLHEPYVEALAQEITRAGEAAGHPQAHTVFIGGGTPTVLKPGLVDSLLDACRSAFDLLPGAEISCEANPGTVDQAQFDALRAAGVNRLSLGVQSFDDAELRWLGRIHDAGTARAAFEAARHAGFDNVNIDLMFGLPEQNPEIWDRSLKEAIALGPEHLSLYSLIVEPGTPLAEQIRQGLRAEPDDDLAADLYLAAAEALAAAGYDHYEISNWARGPVESGEAGAWQPRFACRHNLVYWRNERYFGLGAGAHGYDGERRRWNVRGVAEYIQAVRDGSDPEEGGEPIGKRLSEGETMMVGLRLLREGVGRERFRRRFGEDIDQVFPAELAEHRARGWLEVTANRVRLTPEAHLLANRVCAAFLPD